MEPRFVAELGALLVAAVLLMVAGVFQAAFGVWYLLLVTSWVFSEIREKVPE